jgi:hypothetical protein
MKRLKYVSRQARRLADAEIDALVAGASSHNEHQGISGILVTTAGLFLQVIEGPADAIDALFARIEKDPRHTDVLLLESLDDVEDRIFPDWSMRRFDLDASDAARFEPLRVLLEAIVTQRTLLERQVHALERAIWLELARKA